MQSGPEALLPARINKVKAKKMKKILVVLMLVMAIMPVKAQMLALKTNALMDVAMVPNIGLEIATGNKTSLCANGFASWNIYGMKAKTYGFIPEFRYWLSGNTFSKLFLGVGATLAHYDIDISENNYNGSTYGAGLNIGYDYWLSDHFSVEFHGGVGMYYYHHARTGKNDILPENQAYNDRGWTVLPYQLGISFVYIIK